MYSRALLVGIISLLIAGMFLSGCARKEEAPAPFPTKPSIEEPPAPVPERKEPAPTSRPPRPETPFVYKERGIVFEDDFEDRVADGWELELEWNVEKVDGRWVLSSAGQGWAYPNVPMWSDYSIEAKFKLIAGSFRFNFRLHGDEPFYRYFLGIGQNELYLCKEIGEDSFDLFSCPLALDLDQWYKAKVVLKGSNIQVYFDEELKVSYRDTETPILLGKFAFESLPDSHVYIDDVIVSGEKIVQRASWFRTGGPIGGQGYDVRINPDNPDILYVTDIFSGINKSTDGGLSWEPKNKGIIGVGIDNFYPIFCATIDPHNSNVIWIGTKQFKGIYKSTDGGETWTHLVKGIPNPEGEYGVLTFRQFTVDPSNPDIVYASAEIEPDRFNYSKGKIFKTIDGGQTWFEVWDGGSLVRHIVIDPTNTNIIYAGTGIFDRFNAYGKFEGVIKSTDGGKTWRNINNGLSNLTINALAMHPENPQILLVGTGRINFAHEVEGDMQGNIARTTDGGETWTVVLSGREINCINSIDFCPSNPNTVYAAGNRNDFYVSTDGGKTWKRKFYGVENQAPGLPLGIAIHPYNPQTIYLNNYGGGVFKSTDGGDSWVMSSRGYTGARIYGVVMRPDNANVVYATEDMGVFKSTSGGQDWVPICASGGNRALAANPINPDELLIGSEGVGTIIRSSDGGKTWRQVLNFYDPDWQYGHGIYSIAYSPSNPDIVYAGAQQKDEYFLLRAGVDFSVDPGARSYGVFKSTDAGKSWRITENEGLQSTSKNISSIVIHPHDPDIVYIGLRYSGVYKSTDGGESWEPRNHGLLSLDVRSLAIDPKHPNILYVGLGEGVGIFKSTDGGETWQEINKGIQVECPSYLLRVGQVQPGISLEKPRRVIGGEYWEVPWTAITTIVVDPIDTEIVYAGDRHSGVYMSCDGGANWAPINEGLTIKAISLLTVSEHGNILYAGTEGGGVFRLELW